MARRVGFKTIRHSWMDPFYRPKPKPVAPAPLTEEQEAEAQAERDAFTQRFLDDMAARSAQRRGLEKLVDREARVAVEGDTDLNHDNVEAAE